MTNDTKQAFTPGPWEVGISVDEQYDWPVFRLANLTNADPDGPEVKANARLIAAAPDLLRVIDFAADALEMIDLTCHDSPGEGKRCEECGSCAGFFSLQWAREVIAKATGAPA